MILERFEAAIKAVCPIDGVRVAADGSLGFDPSVAATNQQISAANSAMAAFDTSDAADAAWLEDRKPQRKAIRQAAAQVIFDNDTYLAIASPTNAQVVAQVRRLTQQNSAVIRRLIQID